ncbi:methyltransferase [Bifidobacterium sp. M0399]|nr:methyltransferase [Bifidobacterium polysaccharolyticum]MBI0151686.1 methyltransferase [Bifidobacterium sp. M0399]
MARPASPDQRRTIQVELAGRTCQVEVSHGVFSSGRLDLGTSVLLKRVPQPPTEGDFLDLGCGWGPIALSMAIQSPEADVYAVDTNLRALDLTARNAQSQDLDKVFTLTPEQVPDDLRFDLIWSNPPIRVGKTVLHDLLMTYLPRLKSQGRAYLVVQRNLGADSLIPWLADALGPDWTAEKYASAKGYRIIEVGRA